MFHPLVPCPVAGPQPSQRLKSVAVKPSVVDRDGVGSDADSDLNEEEIGDLEVCLMSDY